MGEKIRLKNLYKVFGPSPNAAMDLLRGGVSKEEVFSRTAHTVGVLDVDLTIHDSEIFVVMGLSGSGKSTLVRLINRLVEPTAGQILFEGIDIAGMSSKALLHLRRHDMSMVFQSFALMPHMNVLENVAFGMELAGIPRPERMQRAERSLDQVNLAHTAASYPDELSGGMQQRVGLARALAIDPSVMLMDEAFSALDPLIRTEMQDELLRLHKTRKRTIIFISHDLNEAMRIGDRIAVMHGGRVVQVGTPAEILKNPADDYVRSFFRGVDVAAVKSAREIAAGHGVLRIVSGSAPLAAVLAELMASEFAHGAVVAADGQYLGAVSQQAIRAAIAADPSQPVSAAFLPDVLPLAAHRLARDIIGPVARSALPLPVVDSDNRYLGVISREILLKCLDREGGEAHG